MPRKHEMQIQVLLGASVSWTGDGSVTQPKQGFVVAQLVERGRPALSCRFEPYPQKTFQYVMTD